MRTPVFLFFAISISLLAQSMRPPVISPNGIVNAAGGASISPASLVSIFGSDLSAVTAIASPGPTGDYPTSLGGVVVRIGGRSSALIYVSPTQINAQIPGDLNAGSHAVTVTTTAGASAPVTVTLTASSPGIFPNAIVRSTDFAVPSPSQPARTGDVLIMFCTGLGTVSPPLPAGRVAPFQPLSYTVEKPKVSMGGRDAEVLYSVLAPGYIELNQVAFRVPDGIGAGSLSVQISTGGRSSNQVSVIAVGNGQSLPLSIKSVKSSALSKTGDRYVTGSVVRIDVTEGSGESDIAIGTVRITSASQNYDSGVQSLTLKPIFYQWNTAGLNPAGDYKVTVTLTDRAGHTSTDDSLHLALTPHQTSIRRLVDRLDLSLASPGIPLALARAYVLDSGFDGPLGYGWSHNYMMGLVETSDGLVKVFNQDGSGSFFHPTGGGGYAGRTGDARSLSKNADGTFVLREKSGGSYVFDSAGRLREVVDRNRNAVRLGYDSSGRLESATGAPGQRLAFTYGSDQRLSAVADSAGRRVQYSYDSDGNLASFSDIGGNKTAYAYDERHVLTSITDAAGKRIKFAADADRRLLEISVEGGAEKLTFTYDPVLPDVTVMDALGNRTVTTYDNNGLPVSVRNMLGHTSTTGYDWAGNPVFMTDANGNRTEFSYDQSGDLLVATNALGQRTTFSYDPVFHMPLAITDASGRITTYQYDATGNRTAIAYPDASSESFAYDQNGNLTARTDRMGRTTRFAYDTKGQLVAKIFPDLTQDVFTYDTFGNLASATNRSGTTRFIWDASGRPTRVESAGGTVTYSYDAVGNRTRVTYPEGTVVDYEYDRLSRLEQVKRNGVALAAYKYDVSGRVVRRTLTNGTASAFDYDAVGRLTALVNLKPTAEILSRFSYTHDAIGNRTAMNTVDGTTQYFYDVLHRLTRVIQPNSGMIEYTLDAEGNRVSVAAGQTATPYTANNLNQYTQIGNDSYAYDRNGNLVSKRTAAGTTSYQYDFENRLVRVETPAQTVSFEYDALGRRSRKVTAIGHVDYVYDGLQVIIETAGSATTKYFYGGGLDEVLVMQRNGLDYYYAHDGLGSVSDLTDSKSNHVESYKYDPYGKVNQISKYGNPFLFNGRPFDPESGLYYLRARYYDPEAGRFISADPLGYSGGTNLYGYVNSNPVSLVDPSGLASVGVTRYPWLTPHVHIFFDRPVRINGKTYTDIGFAADSLDFFGGPSGPLSGENRNNYSMEYSGLDDETLARAVEDVGFGKHFDFRNYICVDWTLDVLSRYSELRNGGVGGTVSAGDPTFIQARTLHAPVKAHRSDETLAARISVPPPGALVRGRVPVYGIATGAQFQSYRVQYGQGRQPSTWLTVSEGSRAQDSAATMENLIASGDATLEGNLGTWDTGLRSYVYLPTYPAGHPIDLHGVYTIRLVVTGRDGSSAEDRVTVEVGEAIPNAWGGVVRSDDSQVSLDVPEQALADSFRVLSIKHMDKTPPETATAQTLLSAVYEFREPGERFAKPVRLEMPYPEGGASATVISRWDPSSKSWTTLPTVRDDARRKLLTEVTVLSRYYALTPGETVAAAGQAPTLNPGLALRPTGDFLIRDNFEETMGQWSNRDGEFGAEVALDRTATLDGTRCLRVATRRDLGNFAVTVVRTPFDVRDYPVVKFDYRIRPEAKINFLVKASGRWYEVRFTDDPKDLAYKRVNIAPIGVIGGVTPDDAWHTAEFNLLDMLRTRTGNTLVEEVVMADWDVTGFMKLQPGKTRRGVAFYIDNFSIRREAGSGLRADGDTLAVDRFDQKKDTNELGGAWSTYADSTGGAIRTSLVNAGCDRIGHCLQIAYAVPRPGAFAGAATGLQGLDLRSFHGLTMRVRAGRKGEDFVIGLKDRSGHESKMAASRFLGGTVPAEWTTLEVPLTAFSEVSDWGHMDNLSLSFESRSSTKGDLLVDDIEFRRALTSFAVEGFEAGENVNAMGRPSRTFLNGAVAISGGYAHASPNRIYRLSFGGNIGEQRDYAGNVLGYAGWSTGLGGINCSQCQAVSFLIRGAEGGEKPNLYLDDGNHRWGVDVEKYAPITTAWNRVTIPLKDFAEYGVDLTHLSELQVVFEWERMSGTIYLDDIRFGSATASSALPVVTGTNAGVGTMKKAASRPNGRSIQR